MYAPYRKIRNIAIPVDIQQKIFDCFILPIMIYSSEVWGFKNKQGLEQMHLQFCKNVLHVRKSIQNFMVYGELGRYPINITIKLRMVMFWNDMLSNENKLTYTLYRLLSLHK